MTALAPGCAPGVHEDPAACPLADTLAPPTGEPVATAATVYRLARLAEVADPDNGTSPGAVWLLGVWLDVREALEEAAAEGEPVDREAITARAAVNAVPWARHDRWRVWTDLALYCDEATDEALAGAHGADEPALDAVAGYVLTRVAERLAATTLDVLPDAEARAIAALWQSSGRTGSHLAALASGCRVARADVALDVLGTIAECSPEGEALGDLERLRHWAEAAHSPLLAEVLP